MIALALRDLWHGKFIRHRYVRALLNVLDTLFFFVAVLVACTVTPIDEW